MQENIIDKYPDLPISVYLVWEAIRTQDSRAYAARVIESLNGPKVSQYWDGANISGKWFKANIEPHYEDRVAWDIYYLFGPEAKWDDIPEPLVGTAHTVIANASSLQFEFESIVEKMAEYKGK